MQVARGYNPYKMGVVGASDSHNTVVAYSQADNFGSHGMTDQGPKERLAGKVESGMEILKTGLSALGGVWAESNTRESIFDAMKRKEVFGTSGVRITVRLFGGWDFKDDVLNQTDWVKTGYKSGVPMGADLPAKNGDAPSFIVWATKDPEDGNLDRIQIIKGWTKAGQILKVFDVAWSGDRKPIQTGRFPSATRSISRPQHTRTPSAPSVKKVWKIQVRSSPAHFLLRQYCKYNTRWSTYDAGAGGDPARSCSCHRTAAGMDVAVWYTPRSAEKGQSKHGCGAE
jgi:hypothetical protein